MDAIFKSSSKWSQTCRSASEPERWGRTPRPFCPSGSPAFSAHKQTERDEVFKPPAEQVRCFYPIRLVLPAGRHCCLRWGWRFPVWVWRKPWLLVHLESAERQTVPLKRTCLKVSKCLLIKNKANSVNIHTSENIMYKLRLLKKESFKAEMSSYQLRVVCQQFLWRWVQISSYLCRRWSSAGPSLQPLGCADGTAGTEVAVSPFPFPAEQNQREEELKPCRENLHCPPHSHTHTRSHTHIYTQPHTQSSDSTDSRRVLNTI